MGNRLYVGNLPYKTTDQDLQELFGRAGAVQAVQVMREPATGRARGFAFVEMATDDAAQKAIAELNEYQLDGRALVVNEARPRARGGGRGFGPSGGDDFGGGGGGGDYDGGRRREPRW